MVLKKKVSEAEMEKMRESVISKGGHVSSDLKKKKKEWIHFCLRIDKKMIEEIESVLESRVGITKTGFILEAIQEKLRR